MWLAVASKLLEHFLELILFGYKSLYLNYNCISPFTFAS